MGLATLVGFEAAANMAEEAKDPFRSVPRAILGSLIASGVLGMLFVIALTVSIKDIARTSASGSAVALIIHDQLGPVMERILLVGIIFAFFGGGLVAMVTAPRIVFAMSRDERFPAHRLMRRVHARTQTPVSATILIFTAAIILIFALPGDALMPLIEASAIGGTTLYGMTVILYLAVRKRLDRREGGIRTRALRGAGRSRSAGVGGHRVVRGHFGLGVAGAGADHRRPVPRRRGVLRLLVVRQTRGAGPRTRGRHL